MFRKHKQLIVGILIGVFVTSAVVFADEIRTFVATEAQFPVLVDGAPVQLDMPVVVIEGRTYLPLRAMGDVLNIFVDWDATNSQVIIDNGKLDENGADKMQGKYIPGEDIINNQEYVQVQDGTYFVTIGYISHIVSEKGYSVLWDEEAYLLTILKDGNDVVQCPMTPIGVRACIPYDKFIDEILPLIR